MTSTKRRIDIMVEAEAAEYAGDVASHRCSLGEVITYALEHLQRTMEPEQARACLKARFAEKGGV